MCFKNLIEIYRKELELKFMEFGPSKYYKQNVGYICIKYLECWKDMKELIRLLKANCNNHKFAIYIRNSDKLFVDLYYEFNK